MYVPADIKSIALIRCMYGIARCKNLSTVPLNTATAKVSGIIIDPIPSA